MHLRVLLGLVGVCFLTLAAVAQTKPDELGPGDEVERALYLQTREMKPVQAEPLIKEAARRRMARLGLDEPHALILVHRKLAAAARAKGEWLDAQSHLGAAQVIATALQDADLMIRFAIDRARIDLHTGDRAAATEQAQSAWELSIRAHRPAAQIEAGLLLADLCEMTGQPRNAEPYFDAMMALPVIDHLPVALRRARMTAGYDPELAEKRWGEVEALAKAQGDAAARVRATDALGGYAVRRGEWTAAVARFGAADKLAPHHDRSPNLWYDYSKALTALGDAAGARRAVDAALADIDPNVQPGTAADLEDARAKLLDQLGDPAGAYAALRRSIALRAQVANGGFAVKMARLVPPTPTADTDQAAALAAARNALREAELARTRDQRRAALWLALSGALVAAALALAYIYKRRAAGALAAARDAAELRAERTHWQMLRYQLNPHFLFNALASLSGLIALDPPAARRVTGRLSDFCRLALQCATGDLRTVDDEMALLAAFVDVELAGSGDGLQVDFQIEPAARAALLPPLLLQPLVENALKYGEPGADGGRRIVIAARRREDGLVLEVANTGEWIDPAQNRRRRVEGGVGLDNVRERLARTSPAAALTTESAAGWVRVRVVLPALTPTDAQGETGA